MNEVTQKTIETEEGDSVYYKYSCCHNEGVSCSPYNRHCETCGWNPEVAEARLIDICIKLGILRPVQDMPPAGTK